MPVELIELIPPEVKLEARQCNEIINRITGYSWKRDLDPRARWATLFYEAKLNEKIFECVMDEKSTTTMEVDGETGPEIREVFNQIELEGVSMKKLQEKNKQCDGCNSNGKWFKCIWFDGLLPNVLIMINFL